MRTALVEWVVALFLVMVCSSAFGAGVTGLTKSDYIGTWKSGQVAMTGEKQILTIRKGYKSSYERILSDGGHQNEYSNNIRFVGDIAIISYDAKASWPAYKLVLSGWKDGDTKQIFGIMYMYQHGALFNGIPISLHN